MESPIAIRPSAPGEEEEICALVKRVFDEFVAPGYPAEGVEEFFRFADPQAMRKRAGPGRILFVAEQDDKICGMIETRQISHISLLFVGNRGKGIARKLLDQVIGECRRRDGYIGTITANSSPFALPVYRRLGFSPTGPEQTVNGITFIPVALRLPGLS